MIEQILLLLGLAGFVVALHIFLTKRQNKVLVCTNDGIQDCNAVVNSKYNKTFGVANEISGMFYYGLVVLLSGLVIYGISNPFISWFLLISGGAAFLASIYFTYLQGFVLKKWCYYCVTSAIITLLIFMFELILYV